MRRHKNKKFIMSSSVSQLPIEKELLIISISLDFVECNLRVIFLLI